MSTVDPTDDGLLLDEYVGQFTLSGFRVAFGDEDISHEHGYSVTARVTISHNTRTANWCIGPTRCV